MSSTAYPKSEFRKAWAQRTVDWLFFIPVCGTVILALKWGLGIRINELRRWRERYRVLTDDRTPLIVCSNHLTYVDSIILVYALGNHFWYFGNFRRLQWNMPAANYRSNLLFRVVFFFSKCLLIDRQGTAAHKRGLLDVMRELLRRGEVLTLFPEGRRSKTGRFDEQELGFGVGKIASQLPECRVLCLYVRSSEQTGLSKFPPRGAHFDITEDLLTYGPGEIAAMANPTETITREVAWRIQKLEAAYFGETALASRRGDRDELGAQTTSHL